MPNTAVVMSPQARIGLVALFAGAVSIAFAPIFVRLSEIGPVATAFTGCCSRCRCCGCG